MKKSNLYDDLLLEGKVEFVGDIKEMPDTLYGVCLRSPSVGRVKNIELPEGDYVFIGRDDVPKNRCIGIIVKDVPVFPDEVEYVGEIIGCVLSKNVHYSKKIVSNIKVDIEEKAPIISSEKAVEKGFLIGDPITVKRGGKRKADFEFEGKFSVNFQEHFYIEPQSVYVLPLDKGRFKIYCTTQHPVTVQETVAWVLGIDTNRIEVEVPRLGGAFGGKEESPTILAVVAAIGSYKTGKPVKIVLSREEDAGYTGKRHAYVNNWKIGVNKDGKIENLEIDYISNGGAYADLSIPVLERTILNGEGGYFIPYVNFTGKVARTNLPPSTAFRGFGTPQAALMIEYIMDYVADKLGIDRVEIRRMNFYREGQKTPYNQTVKDIPIDSILEEMKIDELWKKLKKEKDSFNKENKYIKKGIAFVPIKYGIAFTTKFLNQGYALIHLHKDGSVSLTTGGVEMGQGISVKMANIVNELLGIPIDKVYVTSSMTSVVAHSSPTAASSAVDLNGQALKRAIERIKYNADKLCLKKFGSKAKWFDNKVICGNKKFSVSEFVNFLYENRVPVSMMGYWKTPNLSLDNKKMKGRAFAYFVWGASVVMSEVDILTGKAKLKKVYIVHDAGKSFNRLVDEGQVRGAFIQGSGYLLWEDVYFDERGRNFSNNASTYKIPTINDVPDVFDVKFANTSSDYGVLRSKGIGEPPFLYGIASYLSVLDAVKSYTGEFPQIFPPVIPEKIIKEVKKYE